MRQTRRRWAWWRGRVRSAAAAVALGVAATPAAAAEAGGEAQRTLLQIFLAGIEVPTYFIVVGSVVAVVLVVDHFLNVRTAAVAPPDQIRRAREQIEARNFRECLDGLRKSSTFFAQVMTAALSHGRHGFEAMHEAALEKSGELSGRMFRKAEYLNIIGNLGPLLGLLGTVWGMIDAFGSLGAAGGAAGGQLADGISKALVNTAAGLALAIVGIGFFGVCRNRIDALTTAATVATLDLLEYFRPAAVKGAAAPEKPRAAASAGAPRPGRAGEDAGED